MPDAPLHVALLCHAHHGGSGVVAAELALALAEGGHRVHVLASGAPARLRARAGGVAVRVVPGADGPQAAPALAEALVALAREASGEGRPLDLVHAHYAAPHAVAAAMARERLEPELERPPRFLATLHGTDVTQMGRDPELREPLRRSLARLHAWTAVSEDLAAAARSAFGPGPEGAPLTVVPNFVDEGRFRPERRRDPAPPTAVHVGSFRPLKRAPWLVEAFGRACAGREARLLLVGDGPERSACLERARELGLGPRVEALGLRDDLPLLLPKADLFVLASEREAFGLAALEAMACGLPVLAPRVGGLPEVVEDGVGGRLCAPDDPAGFVRALAELLFDAPRARRMGRAARARVEERFGRAAGLGRYLALYRALLTAAGSDGPDRR